MGGFLAVGGVHALGRRIGLPVPSVGRRSLLITRHIPRDPVSTGQQQGNRSLQQQRINKRHPVKTLKKQ